MVQGELDPVGLGLRVVGYVGCGGWLEGGGWDRCGSGDARIDRDRWRSGRDQEGRHESPVEASIRGVIQASGLILHHQYPAGATVNEIEDNDRASVGLGEIQVRANGLPGARPVVAGTQGVVTDREDILR